MAIAAGAAAIGFASSAGAQNCMEDRFFAATGGHLVCTANDVRIASAGNIKDLNGNPLTSCTDGQTFSFTGDFTVVLGAQARYDIGLYFATDGDPNADGALKGTCSVNVIRPKVGGPETLGSANFINLDAAPDTCGDIDATHNPQIVRVQVNNVLCEDSDGDGQLNLPNCTSWRQPGSNQTCTSALDAYPGSPSKCNCDIAFNIPVRVETVKLTVTKDASPASLPEPGGEFTYTVGVSTDAAFNNVILDRICDDKFGLVAKVAAAPACPAGTLGTINSTDCAVPQTLTPGNSYSCTFKANVTGEPKTVTDTVTADGHIDNVAKTPLSDTDDAQVSITNVPPTATVVKSLVGLACADVDYQVKVNNTDTVEAVTLTALNDDGFGSLTSVHDNVLATTCGIATGQGGAGTLPASIAVGGNYTCTFRAHFCGASHTDKVTASVNDNDGNSISPESNSLTVNVSATVGP